MKTKEYERNVTDYIEETTPGTRSSQEAYWIIPGEDPISRMCAGKTLDKRYCTVLGPPVWNPLQDGRWYCHSHQAQKP